MRDMSAEDLQSSNWVRDPDFLRTGQFSFVPNTVVVDNINLGVLTKAQDDDSISSLSASAIRPVKGVSFWLKLILFGKFSSYQKTLSIAAPVLHLFASTKLTVP